MTSISQPFWVTYADAPEFRSTDLCLGTDFFADFDRINRYFMAELSVPLADLLRIGMAIFVVDRCVRRRRVNARSWIRCIKMKVEVAHPEFWASREMLEAF
jgi:hypothetical protein